jgi:coatomer protein complex subunit alpha (xenin)
MTIGKQDYLRKMLEISQKRGDIMSRFSNALLLGDIDERIKVLADSNQMALAYFMAVAHNRPDLAEPLKSALEHEPGINYLFCNYEEVIWI